MRDAVRRFWVLVHVNSESLFGRFDGHWTRTSDIDVAALFLSAGEADNALQALRQEAEDRCAREKEHWPSQMWWDIHGGLVIVRAVEQRTRVLEDSDEVGIVAARSSG